MVGTFKHDPYLRRLQPSCVRFDERSARCIQFPGQLNFDLRKLADRSLLEVRAVPCIDRSGACSADVLCHQLTSRCDQCGNQIGAKFWEVFCGIRCWCSFLLPSSLLIRVPLLIEPSRTLCSACPEQFPLSSKSPNSRSTSSRFLALSRGVPQTYESVEVWVAMRRALKVTMGADTCRDFQLACAVGVMRAVSAPWQGATRRVGYSLLGVQNPSIPSLLTLGR